MSNEASAEKPWTAGLAAARANLLPGLALQTFALLVVLSYYFVPAFHDALAAVGRLKASSGVFFGLFATAVFGGLIPFIYLRASRATRASTAWSFLPFYLIFWAYRGVEVDLLYRLQSLMFGSGNEVWTIVRKVLFDQFVYNVVWASSLQYLSYYWMGTHYRFSAFRTFDWKDYFRIRMPGILISTWGVWLPMVTIIYCLPSDLQIPLFNIVLCFWVLIVASLSRNKHS